MLLMQYFSRLLLFFMPCCGILIFLFLHKPRISFDGCGVQTVTGCCRFAYLKSARLQPAHYHAEVKLPPTVG
jgi:hypothetical protein